MAKDLVRTRSHVQKMIKMKTQLQAVSLRLQTVKSQNAMANAIKGVARVRSPQMTSHEGLEGSGIKPWSIMGLHHSKEALKTD